MKLKLIPLILAASLLVNSVLPHKTEDEMDQRTVDERMLSPEQIKMKEQQELLQQ